VDNNKAIRFYRKQGWKAVGEKGGSVIMEIEI
jgi:hypothetical protein